MNTDFTQEDYKNIAALIAIAPIKGSEAMTVAVLQQKLMAHINEPATPEKPEDKPKKGE